MIVVPGTATLGSATWAASGVGVDPVGLMVLVGDGQLEGTYLTGSLRISATLGNRGTAQARFVDFDSTKRARPGDSFRVYDGSKLLFAGTVETAEESIPGMRLDADEKFIDVTAVDFSQLADRILVARVYETEGQTADEIARALVDDYLATEGVTADGVEPAIEVAKIVFNYVTVAAALDQLALLTGYAWWIDVNRVLRFSPRAQNAAPWSISDSSKPYLGLSCSLTRSQYRNRQTIRAGRDVGESRTRSFLGDGETSTWDVESPIAQAPRVFVNGAAQTVGIRDVDDDEDPSGFSFFWQRDSTSISRNREKTKLTAFDVVRVDFEPFIPILVQSTDDGEVAERAAIEGGSGLYEAIEYDERIEDAGLAIDLAVARLRRFGRIHCIVSIVTDRAGIRVGQLQTIDLTAEGISGEYLVDELEIEDLGGKLGNLRYRYRALDGEGVGSWPEFFRRLAERGAFPRGQENEVLLQGSTAEAEIIVSDSFSYAEPGSLEDFELDPATVFQIGLSPVGERVVFEGQVANYGVPIGEVSLP